MFDVRVYAVFICLMRIFSIGSSSRWVSLSAAGGSYDAPRINSTRYNEEIENASTFLNSTTAVTTTEYLTEDVDILPADERRWEGYSDELDHFYSHSDLTPLFVNPPSITDTHVYIRSPGSLLEHKVIRDTIMPLNRTNFTEDLIWKLIKNNKTEPSIQVNLHPTVKDFITEQSKILIDVVHPSISPTTCQTGTASNYTCGPVVEIVTSPRNVSATYEEPIVEIRFDITEYDSLYSEHRWTCVYWEERDEAWKEDGLETTSSIGDHIIVCKSTHLTLFSVLLDPHKVFQSSTEVIGEAHEKILTIISIVGSLITILCVLITISSYFWRRSDSETAKIFLQSCLTLLLTHLAFQAHHWFNDRINCRVINFSTHYSVTSFLLWAACDGVNMWRMLFTDIFNINGPSFYGACMIVSWGLPLLTTTIGVLMTDYSAKCQLGFKPVYEFGFYVLPCSVILCSNSLLFVWMMAKVICKNSLRHLRDRKVKYVLALAQVFNVVWCVTFPLLWYHRTRLLGQYLVAVLVSTQGVMILILRCAKDSEFQRGLLNFLNTRCPKWLPLSTFLTSNSTKRTSTSKSSDM